MVDASICGGMELGPPQLSVAALIELRTVLGPVPKAAGKVPGFVSSLDEEGGSCETAANTIHQATDAATAM